MSHPPNHPIEPNPPPEISIRPTNFSPPTPSTLRPAPPQHRLNYHPDNLTVYGPLHALNCDFEEVLADLAMLHKMRLFRPHLSNILRIRIQEIRAHVTCEVLDAMLEMEQEDWATGLQFHYDFPQLGRTFRLCFHIHG